MINIILLYIVASSDKKMITDAMHTLMYAVGTPISGQTTRTACVYFRPKTSSDTDYLRFVYGGGCSATVSSNHNIQ